MKLKKFNENTDFSVDEELVDMFDLESKADCFGYAVFKNNKYYEISFLLDSITDTNADLINKVKQYIGKIDDFEIKRFDEGGVELSFYVNDINFKKLEDKIRLFLKSKKFNI